MKSDEKTVAIIGIGSVLLLLIGFFLDIVTFNDIVIGVVFALILSVGYFVYERKWLVETLSGLSEDNSSNGYKDDLTDKEAREKVQEWAEDEYPEATDIEFHWNNAEDATVRVPSSLKKVDMEKLYAVWTDTAIFNQGVQVFYNCTTDEKLSHRKIQYKEQREKPFMFCDYYRQAIKNTRMATRTMENQNQNSQNPVQALGLDTSNLTPINETGQDNQTEEG